MKQSRLHENAFTGIEAAIVMIAFIVVGSVFTYVTLGTGFFTTEVSQKVANAGVRGVSSNIIVVGDILGLSSDQSAGVETVQFRVGLSSGATPVDFRNSQIIISSVSLPESLVYTTGATVKGTWNSSNTGVLSDNQVWTIDATPGSVITPGTEFILEVKPPGGSPLSIRRMVPQGLDPVNILY